MGITMDASFRRKEAERIKVAVPHFVSENSFHAAYPPSEAQLTIRHQTQPGPYRVIDTMKVDARTYIVPASCADAAVAGFSFVCEGSGD